MMKTLITGHKGFIGKNLSTRFDKFIGIDEEYNQLDLYKILDELELDVIFHIGACSDTMNTDLQFMMRKNYLSTKWIVDWAKVNNVKIIYSSSASVYGSDGNEPSNLYGWTKMISEDYVVSNGGIALRYFNVYGPGEEHKGNMASMIYQNYNKEIVKLFPGNPKRDFVHIDDVVEANLYAYDNYESLKGNWYEVGSGQSTTFEAIFEELNIPFEYKEVSEIPNGYQFSTESNVKHWMPDWKPMIMIQPGIKQYTTYLTID
jgi:ADP-L-glycero-D-manno-heptose 6-epimerase